MTETEKFQADIKRTIKHARANNGGKYNASSVLKDITNLFIRSTQVPGELPASCAEYWIKTYIEPSSEPDNEPSESNIEKLCAILSFLEGTDDFEESLSKDDWHMLGELVNYEAEDLPLDVLQTLMGIIVSKGAL